MLRRRGRALVAVAAAFVVALIAGGCGRDDFENEPRPPVPAEIEAPPTPQPKPTELSTPDLTPGAGLSEEMKGNPLGNILNGEGATPTPPVEDVPPLPDKEEPVKPEGEEPAKPDAVLPTKPDEAGQAVQPPQKPAGGESN